MNPTVLIVDDDAGFARAAGRLAAEEGCGVQLAGTLAEARAFVRDHGTDLILLDLGLPDGNGMDLLEGLDLARHGHVVVATGQPSVDSAVRAIASPVVEYLVKPFRPEQLQALLRRIARRQWPGPGAAAGSVDELAGGSAAIRRLADTMMRLASSDAPVLVSGEPGSGRRAVARAIHAAGGGSGPFVEFDCDMIAPAQVESHLFGAEGGPRPAFARAAGGTLLVHAVEHLPHHLQARLLAMVEARLPADAPDSDMPAPPRLLFCMATDPARAMAGGALREDFHYAVSALDLRVPPLRERGEDVVILADLFIRQLNGRYGQDKRLAPGADRALLDYAWPGNVRELRAAVQRAYLLQRSTLLHVEPVGSPPAMQPGEAASITFPVGTTLAGLEQRAVAATLAHFGNDKAAAARALGISVRTIYNHLARRGDGQAAGSADARGGSRAGGHGGACAGGG